MNIYVWGNTFTPSSLSVWQRIPLLFMHALVQFSTFFFVYIIYFVIVVVVVVTTALK